MTERYDYIDYGFDDDCYQTSCALIKMWYHRSQKVKKQREKEKAKLKH